MQRSADTLFIPSPYHLGNYYVRSDRKPCECTYKKIYKRGISANRRQSIPSGKLTYYCNVCSIKQLLQYSADRNRKSEQQDFHGHRAV